MKQHAIFTIICSLCVPLSIYPHDSSHISLHDIIYSTGVSSATTIGFKAMAYISTYALTDTEYEDWSDIPPALLAIGEACTRETYEHNIIGNIAGTYVGSRICDRMYHHIQRILRNTARTSTEQAYKQCNMSSAEHSVRRAYTRVNQAASSTACVYKYPNILWLPTSILTGSLLWGLTLRDIHPPLMLYSLPDDARYINVHNDSENTCSICLDPFHNQAIQLQCCNNNLGLYHDMCLKRHIQQHGSQCPLCRTNFNFSHQTWGQWLRRTRQSLQELPDMISCIISQV